MLFTTTGSFSDDSGEKTTSPPAFGHPLSIIFDDKEGKSVVWLLPLAIILDNHLPVIP
jgi:hypothetical protein